MSITDSRDNQKRGDVCWVIGGLILVLSKNNFVWQKSTSAPFICLWHGNLREIGSYYCRFVSYTSDYSLLTLQMVMCVNPSRWAVSEILTPAQLAPTNTLKSDLHNISSPFWCSARTSADHLNHVCMPRDIELLSFDCWLDICISKQLNGYT